MSGTDMSIFVRRAVEGFHHIEIAMNDFRTVETVKTLGDANQLEGRKCNLKKRNQILTISSGFMSGWVVMYSLRLTPEVQAETN